MNLSYIEIATSLKSNSLTFLIGTGFSMYMTNGEAPSWVGLLSDCAERLGDNRKTFNDFFTVVDGRIQCKVELTICAQMLEFEYINQGRNIREEIAIIIQDRVHREAIDQEKLIYMHDFFENNSLVNIITTNYDNLFNDYILPENNRVFVEGVPVGRDNCGLNIYHAHGSILNPESIVLTMDDYFRFQHKENYFSRKLFTLLQETTVVVLGYSLGDFNLNKILNEAKNTKKNIQNKNDIYYVTRESVDHIFQRYYLDTYGIEVIQRTNIDDFFYDLSDKLDEAEKMVEIQRNMKLSILNDVVIAEEIKSKRAFENLTNCFINMGISVKSARGLGYINKVFNKKIEMSHTHGAWEHYAHLANWLIDLFSEVEIRGLGIERDFLDHVKFSFTYMSKDLYLGYSWHSYAAWDSRWSGILIDNRELIYEYMHQEEFDRRNNVEELLEKHLKTR